MLVPRKRSKLAASASAWPAICASILLFCVSAAISRCSQVKWLYLRR